MKKAIVVILVGFVMATSSIAYSEPSPLERCNQITILSEQIMKLRQKGVKQRKLVNAFMKVEYGELIIPFIESAYDKPRYSSKEYQEKAISDFSNEVFGMCLDNLEE